MVFKSDTFNNLLKKIDRICGTLEPTTRRVGFLRFAGQEYLYGTDGCFEGFLLISNKAEGKIFQNYISAVEIPLDILKTFLKDVKGDVEISIGTEDIFVKVYRENLKVRTGIIDKTLDFTQEEFSKVDKNVLTKKLDFVSGYLEEGNFVDLFFHPTYLELISHNYGITAYTKLPLETKRVGKLALSFVSVRHFVKTLELEENDEFLISPIDGGVVGTSNDNYYRICASYLQHSSEKIAEVVRNFEPKAYVEVERFSNMLKKSLVAGKFADVVVYSMDDELVVNSFQRGIVYKATTDITTKERILFSFKTKSYFLRSALVRIGSKKVLFGTYNEYVILSSLNRERFLVVKNER